METHRRLEYFIIQIKQREGLKTDLALAEMLGVHRQVLSDYKSGKLKLSADFISKLLLLEYINGDAIAWLLTGQGEKPLKNDSFDPILPLDNSWEQSWIRTLISKNIEFLLSQSGVTTSRAAKGIGITQRTLAGYLNGASVPSEVLYEICEYFNVTPNQILLEKLHEKDEPSTIEFVSGEDKPSTKSKLVDDEMDPTLKQLQGFIKGMSSKITQLTERVQELESKHEPSKSQ